jgi:hypothetical protein
MFIIIKQVKGVAFPFFRQGINLQNLFYSSRYRS